MKLNHTLMAAFAALGLGMAAQGPAMAEADPLLGQIRPVGFNFCPRGWAALNGQVLPINTNQSLYSLLGTMYGGDGRTSFALPDMRGRTLVGAGQGSGLSNYNVGARAGAPSRTLSVGNLPPHAHQIRASANDPERNSPAGAGIPTIPNPNNEIYTDAAPTTATMRTGTVGNAGGGQGFGLSQPSIVVNYCIAMQGVFPSRN